MTKTVDIDTLFVRVGEMPDEDLARGYSYSMGCFGDESQAHAGLSGYSVRWNGLDGALEQLQDRMGFERGYVTFFIGTSCGSGPDSEDLFAPTSIVLSVPAAGQTVESIIAALAFLLLSGHGVRP